MASNGISTLSTKEQRKIAKINLATFKRQAFGTIGYRVLNNYAGTVSPEIGRPWSNFVPVPPGSDLINEDVTLGLVEFTTEDGDILETE
jgi:uncharacterized membrane protein YebE (DUF533 family)